MFLVDVKFCYNWRIFVFYEVKSWFFFFWFRGGGGFLCGWRSTVGVEFLVWFRIFFYYCIMKVFGSREVQYFYVFFFLYGGSRVFRFVDSFFSVEVFCLFQKFRVIRREVCSVGVLISVWIFCGIQAVGEFIIG